MGFFLGGGVSSLQGGIRSENFNLLKIKAVYRNSVVQYVWRNHHASYQHNLQTPNIFKATKLCYLEGAARDKRSYRIQAIGYCVRSIWRTHGETCNLCGYTVVVSKAEHLWEREETRGWGSGFPTILTVGRLVWQRSIHIGNRILRTNYWNC